jgi:hypothetical protein
MRVFLDVILEKGVVLFLSRFQEFLCLVHTSHQIRLFVGQQRIAWRGGIRMRHLCSFALLL